MNTSVIMVKQYSLWVHQVTKAKCNGFEFCYICLHSLLELHQALEHY